MKKEIWNKKQKQILDFLSSVKESHTSKIASIISSDYDYALKYLNELKKLNLVKRKLQKKGNRLVYVWEVKK